MKTASSVLAILLACGTAGLGGPAGAAGAGQPGDRAVTAAKVAALRQAVDAAEAVRAVKRLQWAYGHYSEFGLWYDFADLFADTGIGHYVQGDLDRAGIRDLFFKQVGQGRLGLAEGRIYPHISFSPVVTLDPDGRQVRARFRILAMLGGYGGNALWFHGLYENAYVREGGVWKVNELSNTAQITGTFSTGLKPSNRAKAGQPYLAFHYDPAQVGLMNLPAGEKSGAGRQEPTDASDTRGLAAEIAGLHRRTQRLADEAAIIRLQHQYADALDAHDVDRLAALFAPDATYESGQQGVYIGRASIRRALAALGAPPRRTGAVDDHLLFQTYVSLSPGGDRALARVDQLGMQGSPAGSAQWTQGIYENAFVKRDGQWRIQALHYYPRLITDYHEGWGKNRPASAQREQGRPSRCPANRTLRRLSGFLHSGIPFSPSRYRRKAAISRGRPRSPPAGELRA